MHSSGVINAAGGTPHISPILRDAGKLMPKRVGILIHPQHPVILSEAAQAKRSAAQSKDPYKLHRAVQKRGIPQNRQESQILVKPPKRPDFP